MTNNNYLNDIKLYYETCEASYIDGWDLNNSLAMHYGYKDATTKNFSDTLLRMNEQLAIAANIKSSDIVLDAGCGIGGSSIYLAKTRQCQCTGITLSENQVKKANNLATQLNLADKVSFQVMSYMNLAFPDNSFDVVWGLESICYAPNKEDFIKEAYRVLKPGGRLVIADGMVTKFENNQHPTIRKWLDGWLVMHLESPDRFQQYFQAIGFTQVQYTNITKNTLGSSRRLLGIFFGATLWGWWKKITFRYNWTKMQELNIQACWHQYIGIKKGLWGYGLIVGTKT